VQSAAALDKIHYHLFDAIAKKEKKVHRHKDELALHAVSVQWRLFKIKGGVRDRGASAAGFLQIGTGVKESRIRCNRHIRAVDSLAMFALVHTPQGFSNAKALPPICSITLDYDACPLQLQTQLSWVCKKERSYWGIICRNGCHILKKGSAQNG
jgi:hypothetical protein